MADTGRDGPATAGGRGLASGASLFVGALGGICWWAVSLVLGARSFGVLGTNPMVGVISGACTGIIVASISRAFYRRSSVKALTWYSPLTVYVAIVIYGTIVFVLRVGLDDFPSGQIQWAVGLQSVLGMLWGVTFFLPVAVLVHALAYGNHRLFRRMAEGPEPGKNERRS